MTEPMRGQHKRPAAGDAGTLSSTPILVTGMHRSGTSAVAGLLAAGRRNGADPGADFANPAGYTELTSIVDFNRDALKARGWFWDAPPAEPPRSENESPDLVERGRALVDEYVASPLRLVKDPRFSLLMPLWRRILVDRVSVVVSTRPALEVAWSLAMRDGFSISLGLALWAAYYRHLAVGLSGLRVIFVDYPSLVDNATKTMARLVDALPGSGADAGIDANIDADTAMSVIRPDLRRISVPLDVRNSYAPVSLAELLPGLKSEPVVVFPTFELSATRPQPWEVDILEEHLTSREHNTDVRAQVALERERGLREVQRYKDLAATYERSTSWRVTEPARRLGRKIRGVGRSATGTPRQGGQRRSLLVETREVALDVVALTSVVGMWPVTRALRGYRGLTRAREVER